MKITYPRDYSAESLKAVLDGADSEVLFLGDPRVSIDPTPGMFDRMAQVMRETGAGLVYSDAAGAPRIDYQLGSIRDNFDFGPVIALSTPKARQAGIASDLKWGALYDVRLRLSANHAIIRIPEPLYSASVNDTALSKPPPMKPGASR